MQPHHGLVPLPRAVGQLPVSQPGVGTVGELREKLPPITPFGYMLGLYNGVPGIGVSWAGASYPLKKLPVAGTHLSSQLVTVSDVEVATIRDVDQDHSVAREGSELVDVRDDPSTLGSHHHLCNMFTNLNVSLSSPWLRWESAQQRLGNSKVASCLVGLRVGGLRD